MFHSRKCLCGFNHNLITSRYIIIIENALYIVYMYNLLIILFVNINMFPLTHGSLGTALKPFHRLLKAGFSEGFT